MLTPFHSLPLGSIGGRVPFGASDPLGITKFLSRAFRAIEPIRHGMVVFYNPNTHTAAVLVLGTQSIWPCVIADEPLSFSFGFSATYPPREGELVLVSQFDQGCQCGVIIGRIPYSMCFPPQGDTYNDPDQYHRRLYSQDELEKRTWDRNIPGMMKPMQNRYDGSTQIATHFRPTDVYPGEFAHVNQHNCGIKGGMFSATLLGGGASLRLSALSNLARLTCESYQRFSLSSSLHEFHNGRYLSAERSMALYQEERLGGVSKEDRVWTFDSEAPAGSDGKGADGENQTMRARIKELSGFFGHLESKFCLRPNPEDSDIRILGKECKPDEGVCRQTIDPSGQYRLSSAGMVVIERTGRIPVPVRKAYPTDKDHDISKTPEVLKPFEHDDSDPGFRQLELFDRQAYDLKNQYSRVDGLGFTPDYDVPDEEDLKPLQDKYDPHFDGNETVKLTKFDKRRAGAYIGEDGSIIIRDAWGSEIVMLGGNVSISCAGNVMLLPGQTALTIAGDDIIQKAQNSVDIHASEHDVRLSAARNMEILGGADENKYQGGVIIESRGKSTGPWDGKDKGEDARVSGITLIAKNQSVVVCGKNLNMRSKKDTRILSGESSMDGNISIAAGNIRSRSSKNTVLGAPESSLVLSDGMAVMASKSAHVSGSTSAMIFNGGRVPGMWIEGGAGPEPQELEDLENDKSASFGFDLETLEKMIFGFRSSLECRTDRSWTIGSSGDFTLYEPAWVQVMKIFDTLKNGGVDEKTYEENGEWSNGKPFPGKDAEKSAKYAELSGLKPVNLDANGGFNKRRSLVEGKSSIEKKPLKDSYLVRK